MPVFELLEKVHDRASFVRFVKALMEERKRAQQIERANPEQYMLDGALGWANGDIPGFLDGALCYFEDSQLHEPEAEPSWRMFADFLYFGKIYE